MTCTALARTASRLLLLAAAVIWGALGCDAAQGEVGHDEAGEHAHEEHRDPAETGETDAHDDGAHGEAQGESHEEAEADAHEDEGGHDDGHADEVTLSAEAIQHAGLVIESARRTAIGAAFTVPGRVAFNAEAMAHVGTPVEGRVDEIRVRLGDAVDEGDILLVIDSPALGEAQSELLQKATEVAVARTGLEIARSTYDRSKALLEGKGLSLGEFQRREGEFRIAEGGLLSARAAATAAENRLHLYGMSQAQVEQLIASGEVDARYQVRAPISGRVVEREATLGEIVGPDREALLVLADTSTLWVLADVPEARVAELRTGASARITVAAMGDGVTAGKVAYMAPEIDPESRTASLRIELPAPPAGIQPGMFGQVEIAPGSKDADSAREVISVPEAAVQTVEGESAIFVVVPGEENTFAKRAVTLGPRTGDRMPVLSGLGEGEKFVSNGSFILKAELGKSGAAHEH